MSTKGQKFFQDQYYLKHFRCISNNGIHPSKRQAGIEVRLEDNESAPKQHGKIPVVMKVCQRQTLWLASVPDKQTCKLRIILSHGTATIAIYRMLSQS